VKATLLLADAAQQVGGKLYVLGGGWSICGTGPMTMALALKFEVPWNETNQKHRLLTELLDQDGQPVTLAGAPSPLRMEGALEAGRPAGIPAGTSIDAPLAINIAGIQLPPGGYRWQVSVDEEVVAAASFLVMEQPPAT
jgi:uncharacterized protein DUF6941